MEQRAKILDMATRAQGAGINLTNPRTRDEVEAALIFNKEIEAYNMMGRQLEEQRKGYEQLVDKVGTQGVVVAPSATGRYGLADIAGSVSQVVSPTQLSTMRRAESFATQEAADEYTRGSEKIRQTFESNIDHYCNSDSMKFIKDCFWSNKERDHFKNNKINIAVQIRRENSHDNGNAGERASTPNEYYKKIMNKIREDYTDKEILFHIYSQGPAENFQELVGEDTQFHLNEEITSTFIGMVAADILILSPSSFSYVAGLLSDGKVYYKNFWHNKKKEWILCG
jgi:hypothetical protein